MDVKIAFLTGFPDPSKPAARPPVPVSPDASFGAVLEEAMSRGPVPGPSPGSAAMAVVSGPMDPPDCALLDYMGAKSLSGWCARLAKAGA